MLLQDDKKRMGYVDGETVGPLTPEQAFNALPESLKDKNKVIEVEGKSYIVPKNRNADDVKNLNTDLITPKNYLKDVERKMKKIIEKDKRINSKVTKASNVAYDVISTISAALNPMLDQSDVARPNEKLSEKEKKMLKNYNERNSKNMGGLLQNDETRMGYSEGRIVYGEEEGFDMLEDFKNSKDAFVNRMAKAQVKDVKNKKDRDEYIRLSIQDREKVAKQLDIKEDLQADIKARVREMAEDVNPLMMGGRQIKAEGGEIDDQMLMVMTPPMESEMESDDDMEDNYTRFIMEEALSEEEEDMLSSKLEQDEELSMLFDKIIDVAQEFAGSGPVEGPGSGVSDSIPARLSDGEFVFTAKAVEEIGADNLMSMMKDAEAKADERQTAYNGGVMGDQLEKVVTTETRITKPADVMSPALGAEEDNMIQEEVTRNMLDPRVPHVRS